MTRDLAVSFADIRAASAVLAGQIVRTPEAHSRTLSAILGAEIYVKFENMQFTGSFKDRGALNKLAALTAEERARGVVAMSAGNHAQGVAHHAGRLGISATIVMPENTPFTKVRQTEVHGAHVVLRGRSVAEAAAEARRIADDEARTLVHPYDDPKIMAGQGTVAIEFLERFPDLDFLVVPVGGGGLIAGMAVAAKAIAPRISVIGVEAALYPSMYRVLRGEAVPPGRGTIADGIAVEDVGALTLPIVERLVDDIILVDEAQIERAIGLYATIEKTVAEGAGAAPLAAVIARPERFAGRKTGLVLSGGNIDSRLLASVLVRDLIRDGRIARLRIVIPDRRSQLAGLAAMIGEQGGDIIEVVHHRTLIEVSVREAALDLLVECRDARHMDELIAGLEAAGYHVTRLDRESTEGMS